MQDDNILFWKHDWYAVIENQKALASKKANNVPKKYFEEYSLADLTIQLVNEFSLNIPEIDVENVTVSQREIDIDVSNDRNRYFSVSGPHFMKGTAIDVRVPFSGDREMFNVKPSTFNYSPPQAKISRDCLEFTISGVGLTPEKVKAEIDDRLNGISEYLQYQTKNLGDFPEQIHRIVYQALQQRQMKLKADSDLISGLGYKNEVEPIDRI